MTLLQKFYDALNDSAKQCVNLPNQCKDFMFYFFLDDLNGIPFFN